MSFGSCDMVVLSPAEFLLRPFLCKWVIMLVLVLRFLWALEPRAFCVEVEHDG